MKNSFLTAVLLFVAGNAFPQSVGPTNSGPLTSAPTATPYQIVQRGANSQVWQRTNYEYGPSGEVLSHTHRITELATGLNFTNSQSGKWQPSKEEIDILPAGGAEAINGQHQAYFPADIYQGVIELVTPDGVHLKSRPLGLSYFDGTNSVLIAELTNSVGELVGSNQIIYPNAFPEIGADLRYRYTKAGLEQDVIIRTQPPSPQLFGIDARSSRLEVLTEFFNGVAPTQTITRSGSNTLSDSDFVFGAMRMGHGKAFSIGTGTNSPRQIPVSKSWLNLNGRTFLVEELFYQSISAQLSTLPSATGAATVSSSDPALRRVSRARLLPPMRLAGVEVQPKSVTRVKTKHKITRLAKLDSEEKPAVVLDYVILNGYQSGATVMQSGTTYFISGPVYCQNLTLEGGAVVKYPNNTTADIEVGSAPVFVCQTGPYQPCIFTAGDDDSVGESVSGAWSGYTGTIQSGGYANPALQFDDNASPLHDVRISYAQEAISAWSGANISVTNAQIINCEVGVALWGSEGPGATLSNCLIASPDSNHSGIDALSGGGSSSTFLLWNCTIDNFSEFMGYGGDGAGNADVENSVLSNIGDWGTQNLVSYSGDLFWNTPDMFGDGSQQLYNSPFEQVAGGAYYMSGSYLPVVYNNQTINQDTILVPQLTGTGYGYSYARLDYIFSQTTINGNLTIQPGTVVAWQGQGMSFARYHTVNFNGNPTNFCYFIPSEAVQEQSGTGTGMTDPSGSDSPRVNANFARFLALDSQSKFFDASSLVVNATNCEFWLGQLGGSSAANGLELTLFNCLLDDSTILIQTLANSPSDFSLLMQNCTQEGGELGISRFNSSWPITIADCACDKGSDWINDSFSHANMSCTYNATNSSGWTLPNGANNFLVTSFNWQNGPLGSFYLPAGTGSPLYNAGNLLAGQLGLYHYTTQVALNNPEGASQVDIGYHYVALDSSGKPIDTNGDGIPDYLEDSNGNGDGTDDPTSWSASDGLTTGNGLRVFTPLN